MNRARHFVGFLGVLGQGHHSLEGGFSFSYWFLSSEISELLTEHRRLTAKVLGGKWRRAGGFHFSECQPSLHASVVRNLHPLHAYPAMPGVPNAGVPPAQHFRVNFWLLPGTSWLSFGCREWGGTCSSYRISTVLISAHPHLSATGSQTGTSPGSAT